MACLLSSVIIVPPYFLFEFHELLPALFEGGEQNAPVEVWLNGMEEHGNLPCEPPKDMGDHTEVLTPCALRPFLEGLCLQGPLMGTEGLHKEPRIVHHVLALGTVRLLVVAEEPGHLPRGEGYRGKLFRKDFAMFGYRARNGDDHPCGGPGGDRPFMDQCDQVVGEGTVQGEPRRDPPLRAPCHSGDSFLGEMVPVVELRKKGRLLDGIPRAAAGPGEEVSQGFFFHDVPDLRHDRVAAEVFQRLHPEIAVEEDKGPLFCAHGHGDDLADAVDRRGKAFCSPLYPGVGIAEDELPDLDLPDFPKMSVHDQKLTRGSPSRSISSFIKPIRIQWLQTSVYQRVLA